MSANGSKQAYVTGHHDLPDRDNNIHMTDNMRGHFKHADQNDDGKVTRDEMDAHGYCVPVCRKAPPGYNP
jgi:hypothetical protein